MLTTRDDNVSSFNQISSTSQLSQTINDIKEQDYCSETLLHFTHKIENLRKIPAEYRLVPCINLDNHSNTILHQLVISYANEQQRPEIEGQLKEVLNLLPLADQITLLKTCNGSQESALHSAVRMKHINLVKLLIADLSSTEKDVILLIKNSNEYTILHLAALICPESFADLFSLYSSQSRYSALTGSQSAVFNLLPEGTFSTEMGNILIAFHKIYNAFRNANKFASADFLLDLCQNNGIKNKLSSIERTSNSNIKKVFELSINYYDNCKSSNRKLFSQIWAELHLMTEIPIAAKQVAAIVNALDIKNISDEEAEVTCITNIWDLELSALSFNIDEIKLSGIKSVREKVLDLFAQDNDLEKRNKFNELEVICRRLLRFYAEYNAFDNTNRIENKNKLLIACKQAYELCLSNFNVVNIDEIILFLENNCQLIIEDANHDHKSQLVSKIMRTKSSFVVNLQEAITHDNNHGKSVRRSQFITTRHHFDSVILDELPSMKADERIKLCMQQDHLGNTILHEFVFAKNNLQNKIIHLLQLLDPNDALKLIKMQNAKGYTVFHLAVTENVELISQMLNFVPENERDDILNIQTNTGNTILHLALLLNLKSFESLFLLYSCAGRYNAMSMKDNEGDSVISYLPNDLEVDFSRQVMVIFRQIYRVIAANPRTENMNIDKNTDNEKLKACHHATNWHIARALFIAYKHMNNYKIDNQMLLFDIYISNDKFNTDNSVKTSSKRVKKIINSLISENTEQLQLEDLYADTILQIKFIKLRKQRHKELEVLSNWDDSFWQARQCVIDTLKNGELKRVFRILDEFIYEILNICVTYDPMDNEHRKLKRKNLFATAQWVYNNFKNNLPLSIEKIYLVKSEVSNKCRLMAQDIQQDHRKHGTLAAVGTESELAKLILKALTKLTSESTQSQVKTSNSSFKRLSFLGTSQRFELPEDQHDSDNNDKTDVDRFNELIKKLIFKKEKINTMFKEELSKNENILTYIINQRKSQNRLSKKFQNVILFNSSDSSFKKDLIASLADFINETAESLENPGEKHNFEIAVENLNKYLQTLMMKLRSKSPRNHSSTANDLEYFINHYLVPELKHKTISCPVAKPKRLPIESPTMYL